MAKRIDFVEPVGAMHGALSPKQELVYAREDNPAYYSPVGQRNAARNYKPQYIAMQDAATGRTRFAVRSGFAINMTDGTKRAMALLGATAATYARWYALCDKEEANSIYEYQKSAGLIPSWTTFRQFWFGKFRYIINNEELSIIIDKDGTYTTELFNPYVSPQIEYTPKPAPLIKFFKTFNPTGILFTVDNYTGVGEASLSFATIINSYWNVLGLELEQVHSHTVLKFNGRYVLNAAGQYVTNNTHPADGEKFHTTDQAPS